MAFKLRDYIDFFTFCSDNSWQKQLKERCAHYDLQFLSMVHHDRKVMKTGTWGTWSHCIHSQEAKEDGCQLLAQVSSSFWFSPGSQIWKETTHSSEGSFYLNKPYLENSSQIFPKICFNCDYSWLYQVVNWDLAITIPPLWI